MKKVLFPLILVMFPCLHSYCQNRSYIEPGKYIYKDGTTSDEKTCDKECVGIIIAAGTSKSDSIHGFFRGVVMALNDTGGKQRYSWGPEGEYSDEKDYRWEDIEEMDSEYEAFKAVRNMQSPQFSNSGWQLPSPEYWKAMLRNIGRSDKYGRVRQLERLYGIMNFTHEEFNNSDIGYWLSKSSNGYSANYGYSGGVNAGSYREPHKGFMGDRSKKKKVRAIFVF